MDSFYEAFINTSHKVLGENLKPFSLLHYLHLEAIDSPLIKLINGDTVDLTKKDLELACIVCASSSENIVERITSINFCKKISFKFYSFRKAQLKFLAYLKDYVSMPQTWEEEGEATKLGSPWIIARLLFLMKNTNFTEREILEMPLGKVFWYSASLGELLGGAKIMSEEEKSAIEESERLKNG